MYIHIHVCVCIYIYTYIRIIHTYIHTYVYNANFVGVAFGTHLLPEDGALGLFLYQVSGNSIRSLLILGLLGTHLLPEDGATQLGVVDSRSLLT
jgi:hypothetical protein